MTKVFCDICSEVIQDNIVERNLKCKASNGDVMNCKFDLCEKCYIEYFTALDEFAVDLLESLRNKYRLRGGRK